MSDPDRILTACMFRKDGMRLKGVAADTLAKVRTFFTNVCSLFVVKSPKITLHLFVTFFTAVTGTNIFPPLYLPVAMNIENLSSFSTIINYQCCGTGIFIPDS
jgi:hypothetical protein